MLRRCLIVLLAVAPTRWAAAQSPADPPPQQTLTPAARGESRYRIGDDLASTRWRLAQMAGEPVDAATAPTLEFLHDLQIRGSTGCNRYVGPFASRADKGAFGPFRTSREGCDAVQASRQAAYIAALERGWLMKLDGEKQTLLVYPPQSGAPLSFVRQP